MKTTVIVISTVKTYSDFNQNGFFIGTRDDLGGFLFAGGEHGCIGSEHDDLEIEAFVARMDLYIKYYEVQDIDVQYFCENYGSGFDPIELETNLRKTIWEIDGRSYAADYCAVNKNFCMV